MGARSAAVGRMQPLGYPLSRLRRARTALTVSFLAHGFCTATWATRLPAVAMHLHISVGTVGVVLFSMAVGALVAMWRLGIVIATHGSRPVLRIASLVMCLSFACLGYAPDAVWLTIVLFVAGAGVGSMDVAMNSHGVTLQRNYGKSILNALHGWWYIGALAGASVGTAAAAAGIEPGPHLALVGGVFALATTGLGWWLLPASLDRLVPKAAATSSSVEPGHAAHPVRGRLAKMPSTLAILGLVGLAMYLIEGAITDWSGLYLARVVHTSPGEVGLGYLAFAIAMTAARLSGDVVAAGALSRSRLTGIGASLGAAGIVLAIAVPALPAVMIGLGVSGLGLATIVPTLYTAAGAIGSTGQSIARLTAVSYSGYLFGPPLIGSIGQVLNLRVALGIPAGLALIVAVVGPTAVRDVRRDGP